VAESRAGYASVYIVVATLIGVLVGTSFGLLFDEFIGGRRMLAVLAAMAAIGVEHLFRRFAAGDIRKLFLGAPAAASSLPRAFSAAVIALAGGLAAHDLALVFNVMAGPALGGFAGLFAALMKSVLVVLRGLEQDVAQPARAQRRTN